ncbi:unnamed protein product [Rangifer tarandus platyrhynchus]|uniref:Uncharacterized protein n=2 Tax=Rangifer tarandus platyrhynchus TaxID=3082113 RepID=A0ABN8ZH16_RANTA|nr:unnamed protein product [Rangifer tarandus platyrhynchus]
MTGLLKPSSAVKSDRCEGLGFCQFSKPAPGPGYEVSQNLSFCVCKVEKILLVSWDGWVSLLVQSWRLGEGIPGYREGFRSPCAAAPGAPSGRRGCSFKIAAREKPC